MWVEVGMRLVERVEVLATPDRAGLEPGKELPGTCPLGLLEGMQLTKPRLQMTGSWGGCQPPAAGGAHLPVGP